MIYRKEVKRGGNIVVVPSTNIEFLDSLKTPTWQTHLPIGPDEMLTAKFRRVAVHKMAYELVYRTPEEGYIVLYRGASRAEIVWAMEQYRIEAETHGLESLRDFRLPSYIPESKSVPSSFLTVTCES